MSNFVGRLSRAERVGDVGRCPACAGGLPGRFVEVAPGESAPTPPPCPECGHRPVVFEVVIPPSYRRPAPVGRG